MSPTKIDFYNAALDALQAGRVDDALLAAEDALVEDAKDVETWQLYALILNALGRVDDARRAGEKLRELGISQVDLLAMQAVEALGAGDAAAAAECYESALALAPDRVDLLTSLALALVDAGDMDGAVPLAVRAVELSPEDGQAHYVHGRVLRLGGRKAEALDALTRAVEMEPELMMAVYEQGMLLADADRLEEAMANFEKFLPGAKIDLAAAFAAAALLPDDASFADGHVLGGTMTPGVYSSAGSFFITTTLTLDAQGDPNAFWVFQATSTVITATDSLIVLLNGASADNVFWQVGSSATLGTDSEFSGTIMAQASITMTTGAELTGRALALDGAVTMDNNLIMVPEPGSALLLGFGAVLGLLRRRKASH
jgi:tetratricopeptide (TPR) repeat protein